MTIQVPYFVIFFEDYRKRESVENSTSPDREDSVRWSQELFWIFQVLLHIPYPASPRSHPDLALLSVCLLHSANALILFLRVSAVSVAPSRWCHQVAHLQEQFLVGGVLSLFQSLHMS